MNKKVNYQLLNYKYLTNNFMTENHFKLLSIKKTAYFLHITYINHPDCIN